MFLTKSNIVKMGDFGIARVLNHTVDVARSMVGTPYYLSPEIIESRPYSFKSDIWSMGVLLYELCALRPPFEGGNMHFLMMKISRGQYPPIPSQYSRELKQLISSMLELRVHLRPNINQILKVPMIARRARNFLSDNVFKDEFSHTILHKVDIMRQPAPPQFGKPSQPVAPPSAREHRPVTPPVYG